MAEYELIDLINGISNNMMAGQAIFLTTLSAYFVVAYSVGKSLTTYQVGFINSALLLMMFVGFNAQVKLVEIALALSETLASISSYGEDPGATGESTRISFAGIRLVLVLGAIIFMWQVRHPKTN